jgi:hypothetical protein
LHGCAFLATLSRVERVFKLFDNLSSYWNIFSFDAVNVDFALFKTFKRNNFSLSNERLKLSAPLKNFVYHADEGIFEFNFYFTHDTFVLTVFAA